ncbi:MAG: HD domain-containing protein [Rhodocyclaceae bacterium]|nr:HD domain-containing protein [Rhodocyclaceae bacterium]
MKEALHKYVDLTVTIREMSTPQLSEVPGAAAYREKLLQNFLRIGEISRRNVYLLERYFFPVINADRILTSEETEALQSFLREMLDDQKMENQDLPLILRVTRRLLEDARRKNDPDAHVRALDVFISASYMIIEMTARFADCSDSCARFSEEGIAAAREMLACLEPERFSALSLKSRELVLINSSYAHSLYLIPSLKEDETKKEELLVLLQRSNALKDDAFYVEQTPGYDWRLHDYITLQYLTNLTDFNNRYAFSKEQLDLIYTFSERYYTLYQSDPKLFGRYAPYEDVLRAVARNRYLTGHTDVTAYRQTLLNIINMTGRDEFSFYENTMLFSCPVEYILTLDPEHLSPEDGARITSFYKDMTAYLHRMPKLGNLTFLLTDLTHVINTFVEVEGGVGFERFCLDLLACVHPPTYVHALSVADIARVLTKNLYYLQPELLSKIPGYPDAEAMADFAWHAGLCHDYGKLFLVETIITYGRNLFDEEFEWIRAHPQIGARMLSKFRQTKCYAPVALGHHRWYNGKLGYPDIPTPEDSPFGILVELVTCADCIDAATDDVGRSYKRGKMLEDVAKEIENGVGSQYALFLMPLLQHETVFEELQHILSVGRDENYLHTYKTLAKVMKVI